MVKLIQLLQTMLHLSDCILYVGIVIVMCVFLASAVKGVLFGSCTSDATTSSSGETLLRVPIML